MSENLIKRIRTDKGDCQIDYNALANLPSSMKNPFPITFTGGASAKYDGSSAVTVQVPDVPDWSMSENNPSYTKDESDNRYAPISAVIRPTVTGNPAVCSDSIAWSFQGLKIYGKSTQDGTPSPETPVPIVSAGASGSIALSITDDASQSQSITLSTPSGLPGIPVKSGGNYTDAEGQQWVCNIIDFQSKSRFEPIAVYLFDGSDDENWAIETSDSLGGRKRAIISVQRSAYQYNTSLICNVLKPYAWNASTNTCFINEFQYFTVSFVSNQDIFESKTDFKTWLSENPIELIYQLETPITTPLSAEELAAYRALTTYAGTTVVSTAEPVAGIEARYIVDGTKYLVSVTDRIAALEASQTQIDEV